MVGIDQILFRGKAPWTLHHKHADNETLKKKTEVEPISYPRPDGVLTFDMLSSVFISNTNHAENQPAHLRLKDPSVPINVKLRSTMRLNSAIVPPGSTRSCAMTTDPTRACRSTLRTASIAKPATSRTRPRISCGQCRKGAADRTTQTCRAEAFPKAWKLGSLVSMLIIF